MSSSLLARRILSSSSGTSQPHSLGLLTPLLRSLSLSAQTQHEKEAPFVAQYLISSLGFSPDRAIQVSSYRKNGKIGSLTGPQSVVQCLKETGLSDDKIRAVISFNPHVLSFDADETLKPKLQELRGIGITGEVLVDLIRYNPYVFEAKNAVAKLQYWRNFVGDAVFPKLVRRNGLLTTRDLDRYVAPRMELLREFGLSKKDITMLITRAACRFMGTSLESMTDKLHRAEKLGFQRNSNMFIYGLIVTIRNKKESMDKKSRYLQEMYGWSEQDVHFAFMKFPSIMAISERKIKAGMDFFINTAGFEPRSIARQPMLLGYSLEKRVIPRYHVMNMLDLHGVNALLTLCVMSEKTFKRYIERNETDVPGLADAYAAACSGKVPY